MSFSDDDLQACLLAWPNLVLPDKLTDSLLDRICQVLSSAIDQPNSKLLTGDLPPLLRHYLMRSNARAGKDMYLKVPTPFGWPSRKRWLEHGIEAIQSGGSTFLISALPWHSEWLGAGDGGMFEDAFTDKMVRKNTYCAIDPFVQVATGFPSYSSPGQREAVRAAFLMPENETLIVNLPTGSGKSLVGQAPSIVHREEGHITIFVVPTVALALDQERAMQALFRQRDPTRSPWRLAWYGGLSKEDRAGIRQRLRSGTQRILFTSPEALTTSLLSAVTETATKGMLKYFVIDEAHLVTQWGDAFRPSFQALAGLRNSLLRIAPTGFRTLLLSATFTEETVDTLANLFGPPELVQMVSAVHLRPEPQYWFYKAESTKLKEERVLESLRHAPRPFVLYVTKREEVSRWGRVLAQNGLKRIASFDGGTPDNERLRIINDWSANRLDGIVATSAFGVGLDKSDVRTIIHATIPETLDRFYQEVGRGGRDGKPSVSLLVFDDTDWELPKRLAKPTLISNELGFSRWVSLWKSRRSSINRNLWSLDIESVREGLPGSSDENVKWNMRTLILMARAGLIAIEVESNHLDRDTDPGEDSSSLISAMSNVLVRIRNDGHLDVDIWEASVTASRQKTLTAASRNLELMRKLLPKTVGSEQKIGREVGETLGYLYRISSEPWSVQVSQVCGGCPLDRFQRGRQIEYSAPVVVPIPRIHKLINTTWVETFPWISASFAYVFYDETQSLDKLGHDVSQFARWLVNSCGVQEICTPHTSNLTTNFDWKSLYQHARNQILLHRTKYESDVEPYSPIARLTLLNPDASIDELAEIQMLQRPFHVVILPMAMPDPGNEMRKLVDVIGHTQCLEKLLMEITL
jgi:ATP-dependent DNA helicase RecQ